VPRKHFDNQSINVSFSGWPL